MQLVTHLLVCSLGEHILLWHPTVYHCICPCASKLMWSAAKKKWTSNIPIMCGISLQWMQWKNLKIQCWLNTAGSTFSSPWPTLPTNGIPSCVHSGYLVLPRSELDFIMLELQNSNRWCVDGQRGMKGQSENKAYIPTCGSLFTADIPYFIRQWLLHSAKHAHLISWPTVANQPALQK